MIVPSNKISGRLLMWFAGFSLLGAVVAFLDVIPFAEQPTDRGQVIGRDFVGIWAASQLLQQGLGDSIYDPTEFNIFLESIVNLELGDHSFLYPPQSLLFFWPFAYLSYGWAYVFWIIAGLCCFLSAVGVPDWSKARVILAAIAPATLITLAFGQTSLFFAALLIAGIRSLDRYPILAGVMFGLLTIKPQLGLLVPVALVAGRYWAAIVSATVTTLLLIAASVALWGLELWAVYIDQGISLAGKWLVASKGFHLDLMLSPFMAAQKLGLGRTVAELAQILCALFGALSAAWVFFRPYDVVLRLVVLSAATFLISPYVLNYDLVVLTGALVFVIVNWRDDAINAPRLLALLAWILPIAVFYGPWFSVLAPFIIVGLTLSLLVKNGRSPIVRS